MIYFTKSQYERLPFVGLSSPHIVHTYTCIFVVCVFDSAIHRMDIKDDSGDEIDRKGKWKGRSHFE